jgi:hypothetical protein
MALYYVKWEIDVEAESAFDAAKIALDIQRDPESIATIFTVRKHTGGPTLRVDTAGASETMNPVNKIS